MEAIIATAKIATTDQIKTMLVDLKTDTTTEGGLVTLALIKVLEERMSESEVDEFCNILWS